MIRKTSILMLVALSACGADEGGSNIAKTEQAAGLFTGSLGEQNYEVSVNCRYLDEDYFVFRSDKDDATDSNGDGLIISGDQTGNALGISISDHGRWFSIGRVKTWAKTGNSVSGSGDLWEQGGGNTTLPLTFEVVCD